jgi:hypothetical protein
LGYAQAPARAQRGGAHAHGRAVQVDPIKSKLKPPGTKRLKLNCDIVLSTSAFKFNLRRYSMDGREHDFEAGPDTPRPVLTVCA